jgi:hypothetical protein
MQLGTAPSSSTTPLGWCAATPVYAPRCAEATVLHRVLSRHLGPWRVLMAHAATHRAPLTTRWTKSAIPAYPALIGVMVAGVAVLAAMVAHGISIGVFAPMGL